LLIFIFILTKASRSATKIEAKIKESGICFFECHCCAKVSEKIISANLFSFLTKASRSATKIEAKIKESGICFFECHCCAKVSEKIISANLFFISSKILFK